MKKATKKLLTFALSTLFVGAGLGGSIAAYDALNTKVAAAEETASAVSLDGMFTASLGGATMAADSKYDMTSVYLTSSVAFWTGGGTYLNDHVSNFASIDLMDNIIINGKSARAIFADRGGDEAAAAKYPGFSFFIPGWAPVLVEVLPYNGGTAIRVDVDRRYVPTASLEITIKACEFELGGASYKLSQDVTFKTTVTDPLNNTASRNNLVIKNAAEVEETLVESPFIRSSKWDDHGNYYKFMVSTGKLTFSPNYREWNWIMDNCVYLQDYMLVNGRSVSEIQLTDSKEGINFAGSPIPGNANYDYLVMPQIVATAGESYLSFNVNKDWMKAQGITLSSLRLTIKEGMPYYGADGKVYRTSTSFTAPSILVKDGAFETERVNYGVSETGIGTYEIGTTGLDMQTPNCGWHLTQLDTVGGLNEGAEKNIYINGKSVAEYNAIDDSAWTYTGIGWPNDFHSGFYKPVVLNFAADKMQVFIHPELMKTNPSYIDIEIKNEFIIMNADMTMQFVIPTLESTRVWAKDVTVTLDGVATTYKYGQTVTLTAPAAIEGKTFVKWIDAAGNEVTEFTAENDVTLTSVWENIEYTATVVNGETSTPVKFTVDNRADKLAEIAAMLPENTEDYTYTWAEALPEELALNNDQVFTVAAEAMFVMVDLAIDQDVEITIPAGKYAKAELNTMGGGYVVVSYWQDLIITINGEEYVYDPVKLMPARAGTNIITIKSVSGEAVTDTITISSYTQDDYQMNVGANEVYVLDAQEGRNATFTAEVDGEYTFSFAEGEENGAISVITEDEYGMSSEMVTMPYTLTLTAGETITFTIGTMNWESDTIEINVEAPYVTSDVWPGEETTISIPEGKYFSTNVYSLVGGKFTVSWSGDVTVEINGEAVENGAVVELINRYEGSNTLVIKAANNAAAEVVLNLANYKEPATPIAVGNVNVTVSVENFYCAGVETIFTATEAGEYKLSVAEGEENAAVLIVTDSEFGMMTEDVELPYAFTLEAGESITFIIATTNVMVESDEINLVLEKVEVTPPAGGDEGEGEGEGTNPPAGDEGENTNPPAGDEGENTNPPATEEEPGILDQVKGMIPGCSGVVGGIAGGAAALGLAVVALLKKKEDNE